LVATLLTEPGGQNQRAHAWERARRMRFGFGWFNALLVRSSFLFPKQHVGILVECCMWRVVTVEASPLRSNRSGTTLFVLWRREGASTPVTLAQKRKKVSQKESARAFSLQKNERHTPTPTLCHAFLFRSHS
jgi:hypothetical protein